MKTEFAKDFAAGAKSVGEAAYGAGEKAVHEAGSRIAETANDLKDLAKVRFADLKDSASAATEHVKETVGSLASGAAHSFKDAVEAHKTAGADAIVSVARSARDAVDGIEKQSPQVARMVRSAADSVERVTTDLRDQNLDDLMRNISDFARRQPKLFFGCGILAGLVLSRLLRSSSEA